jgi:hypothetical protein
MDQATKHVTPSDTGRFCQTGSRMRPRLGRLQVEAPMRPSVVVLRGVGPKHPFQVAEAEDHRPVQALGPDRSDPPLGEGVRSRGSDRCLDDRHPLGAEHPRRTDR